jgi:hypothetical protein
MSLIKRLGLLILALVASAGSAMAADPAGVKLQGRIGDRLSTGPWRLQVLSVERSAAYESQFLADKTTTQPSGDADELVVVKCTITNAGKEPKAPMLSAVHPHHTALADARGMSYPPLLFDKEGGHTDEGITLASATATTFAVLFSIPKGAALAEVIVSLQTAYDDYPDGGFDVHVTLGKEAGAHGKTGAARAGLASP